MKTRKSVSERIRVTKTGKFFRRPMGVGHFRAKKRRKQTREKRQEVSVHISNINFLKRHRSVA